MPKKLHGLPPVGEYLELQRLDLGSPLVSLLIQQRRSTGALDVRLARRNWDGGRWRATTAGFWLARDHVPALVTALQEVLAEQDGPEPPPEAA